ncbi:MAG TPA: translesion error-prone DNA polymerase V autoproteolytic subunit [Ferruginibacter sp.]|nr:translesion error-prone DNA polymerase V autoproteolytic subunit [Ferruginibacter sp.]HRQ21299.1 translesion error-prone DNA polymerase V autoproteolytic subunit [Ferruginibacter sp.]
MQEVCRDMQKSTTWKLRLFSLPAMVPVVLPLLEGGVSAGFPSPAADFMENRIDLNKYLIKREATTFIAFTEGHSMEGAGIGHKDLLIIDKSLEPEDGKIAVCVIDGEFTLKRLKVDKSGVWLMPENEAYKPIRVTEFNQFEIWGIVTFSIQKH